MIRPSIASDEAGLKALWQIAFGDPPEAIDAFFSALYTPGMALVWDDLGTIASAMYLLDAGLMPLPDGTMLRTSYAYALGTLPAYRGRGMGSGVTRAVMARSVELAYDCNVICPAEESLFSYYMGLGYDHSISIIEDEILRSESFKFVDTNKIMSTDFSKYSLLHREYAPRYGTQYPMDYLRYVEQSCKASGGGFYELELDGALCLAAVSIAEDHLFVREFLGEASATLGVQTLLQHFNLPSATLRTVAENDTEGLEQRPFILVSYAKDQRLPPSAGYFPFVLD